MCWNTGGVTSQSTTQVNDEILICPWRKGLSSDSAVFLQGSVQADCDLSGLPVTTYTELFQLYQLTQKLRMALTWCSLRVI